jgi:hypothetical protein
MNYKLKGCALAMLLLPSLLLAKKNKSADDPLYNQLVADLVGKQFTTQIVLSVQTSITSPGEDNAKLRSVDTEMKPDGTVTYRARHAPLDFGPGTGAVAVSLEQVEKSVPAGTTVRVDRIDMMNDRIELDLVCTDASPRLKLMVGNDYHGAFDLDKVEEVVSKALLLPKYQRLNSLKQDYNALSDKRASAVAAYAKATSATGKLDAARQAADALKQLIENRKDYDSLKQIAKDPDADRYTQEAANFEKLIPDLQQQAHQEQLAKARQDLESAREKSAQLKEQLSPEPASIPDLDKALATLQQYQKLVSEERKLLRQRAELGEPASPEESAAIRKDAAEGQHMLLAFSQLRPKLELKACNASYQEMEKQRTPLQSAYTRSVGTAKHKPDGQKLAVLLYEMRENRTQAVDLGLDQAKVQAATLDKQLQTLVHQIGPVDFPKTNAAGAPSS